MEKERSLFRRFTCSHNTTMNWEVKWSGHDGACGHDSIDYPDGQNSHDGDVSTDGHYDPDCSDKIENRPPRTRTTSPASPPPSSPPRSSCARYLSFTI